MKLDLRVVEIELSLYDPYYDPFAEGVTPLQNIVMNLEHTDND